MSIREYAKAHNHQVVGNLVRQPEHDGKDPDGTPYRFYMDAILNEYTINKNGVCIVTADGNVI